MRRAARIDANHPQIVEAFRKCGASVISLAGLGDGVPDLLVGVNGNNYLVECKVSKKAKLTPDQQAFMTSWKGAAKIICSVDEALFWMNVWRI